MYRLVKVEKFLELQILTCDDLYRMHCAVLVVPSGLQLEFMNMPEVAVELPFCNIGILPPADVKL